MELSTQIADQISWGAIVPLIIIQLILMIIALVSCIREEETNGPKWLWVIVILFVSILGPVLYFVIGRRNR